MLRELFAPRAAQMKTSFFFATALSAFTAGEVLAKQSQDQVMLILTPETRLEQRCNARAMGTVTGAIRIFGRMKLSRMRLQKPLFEVT